MSSFSYFKTGDGVFLKRGNTWRITTPLKTSDGVIYSAYGTGSKPKSGATRAEVAAMIFRSTQATK